MSLSPISESMHAVVGQIAQAYFKPEDAELMSYHEVEQLSPADQMRWYKAKGDYRAAKWQAEQDTKRESKTYRCKVCLDKHFVFVLPVWAEFRSLPKMFTAEIIEYCLHSRYANIAVPCDCNPNKPDGFYNIFGERLLSTLFARYLVQFRRDIAKQRSDEILTRVNS